MRNASAGVRRPMSVPPFFALLTVVIASGCATVLYPGPRRSSAEVATIVADSASETNDTKIVRIDGKWVGDETFEILPGRHEIEVVGTSRRLAMGPRTALLAYLGRKTRHMVACFFARGGHSYVVRTRGSVREDGPWEVEIFDQKTTYLVHVECDDED